MNQLFQIYKVDEAIAAKISESRGHAKTLKKTPSSKKVV
jgi:hypothetical protein